MPENFSIRRSQVPMTVAGIEFIAELVDAKIEVPPPTYYRISSVHSIRENNEDDATTTIIIKLRGKKATELFDKLY